MPDADLGDALGAMLTSLTAPGNPAGIHSAMLRIDCPVRGLTVELTKGPAQAEGDEPLTAAHPFHVASIAKTMTAVLVLQLSEAGKLDLDMPVANLRLFERDVLDRLPAKAGFTSRQLLTHTAGLRDGLVDDDEVLAAEAGGLAPGSLIGRMIAAPKRRAGKQWIAWDAAHPFEADAGTFNHFLARASKPVGAPGEQFHYSDSGFALLALLAEKLSNCAYHDLLHTRIFEPAGMAHSYLAYHSAANANADLPAPCEIWMQDTPILGSGMDLSFDWGGGGIVATLADLNRFQIALFSGRLFATKATLQQMIDWITPPGLNPPRSGVGLGLFRLDAGTFTLFGHSGAWGGKMFHDPAHGLFFSGTANQAQAPADWHFPFVARAIEP